MNTSATANSAPKILNSLKEARRAMVRSTKRMESLQAVLNTKIEDGMHNAAAHVRAAVRDERDRLFKLSQTLVNQELELHEDHTSSI